MPHPINSPRPSRQHATIIHFATQCVSFVFIITQGIVLVPAYLHYVGVPVYGAWLASSQVLGWICLLDPGTDEVMRQRCAQAHARGEVARAGELIGSGLVVNAMVALAVLLLAVWLAPVLPARFGQHGSAAEEVQRALLVLAFASATTIASYAVGSPLLAMQRAAVFGIISIIGSAMGIVATVALLWSGWGVCAIPSGILARSIFCLFGWGVALHWLCRRKESIRLSVRWPDVRQLLHLSSFTFLSKLASALQASADSVLIGATLGPSATVKYVLTGRVIDTVRVFPDRFGSAIQPSLAHLFGEGDPVKISSISLRFISVVSFSSAFLVANAVVFNKAIMKIWVGNGFYGGSALTALLGVAACIATIVNSGYHVLFASGAIRKAAGTMCLQGLVKIGVAYMLLRSLGLLALPIAGVLAMALIGLPFFWRGCAALLTLNAGERRQMTRSVSKPLLICSSAALIGMVWVRPNGLPEIVACTVLFSTALAGALCLFDQSLRQELSSLLRHLKLVGSLRPRQPKLTP